MLTLGSISLLATASDRALRLPWGAADTLAILSARVELALWHLRRGRC